MWNCSQTRVGSKGTVGAQLPRLSGWVELLEHGSNGCRGSWKGEDARWRALTGMFVKPNSVEWLTAYEDWRWLLGLGRWSSRPGRCEAGQPGIRALTLWQMRSIRGWPLLDLSQYLRFEGNSGWGLTREGPGALWLGLRATANLIKDYSAARGA